ncbi:MAG TPA: hypothetical protein VNA26_09150, partial [Chitinophagaceae bacterium]|nr:hypothetical protein [Chitinophagaceae bacterium]
MKSFLFIWHFVITLIFNACAQSIHDMQKGYAFFKESIPGNIQVDEKGNEIKPALDTVRFVFIEWKGKSSPPIDIVSYRGKIFNASIFPVVQTQVEIGQAKISGENIILKPARGNTLWRILLTYTDNRPSLAGKPVIKL